VVAAAAAAGTGGSVIGMTGPESPPRPVGLVDSAPDHGPGHIRQLYVF